MPQLTVLQLKRSRIPKNLGLCDDDPRLLQWFNEFQEDALNHGRWWGTIVAGEFCTFGGQVAFPRSVACVEQITIGGHTLDAHNQWYRFMSPVSQPHTCDSCGCGNGHSGRFDCGQCGSRVWQDDGTLPVFRQISGQKYIKLYTRSTTDVGKKVLVQGYDVNNEWVRKAYTTGGITSWVDGEYITLGSPFGIGSTLWTAVTGIQKDVTDKNVLAYAVSASGHETLIADWQPDEVNPSYRVAKIPCLGCHTRDGELRAGSIQALVKLEHIPVSLDTDWLILGNMVAIEHGMRARMYYERNQDTAADKEMVRAVNALNHELRTHTGDRTEILVDIGCESFREDLIGFQ